MISLKDLENPSTIIGWWNGRSQERAPYMYNSLFTNSHETSETISMLYGEAEEMHTLSLTTDDADAIRLKNTGFSGDAKRLISFKNYKMMDEKRRNEIRAALNTNNQAQINMLSQTQLRDAASLLDLAEFTREKLAMEALTTGLINYGSDGAKAYVDFNVPKEHKVTVKTPWGNEDSSPIQDLADYKQQMLEDNNTIIEYVVMNSRTFRKIRQSGEVINSLSINRTNTNIALPIQDVKDLVSDNTAIKVLLYDKGDKDGRFIPDDVAVLIPNGSLGRLAWTDTNEALGLQDEPSAKVSTTGNGITLTSYHNIDPVGTAVKVTQKILPALDKAQNIMIINVAGQTSETGNGSTGDNSGTEGAGTEDTGTEDSPKA